MKVKDVYRCSVCGNIVEVLHVGGGTLVCCGKDMILQQANSIDASGEKHVPVIEKTENGTLVKVGSLPHPMEATHYIQWIELVCDGISHRKFLEPTDKPEALFPVQGSICSAREYCNIHGLWKKD